MIDLKLLGKLAVQAAKREQGTLLAACKRTSV
eukprot:CAMPEP_0172910204 /NCGR_PEP_ID=MMETSP1075-20121228/184186_1 /TAXON_ID=2916 /ORGANISM="Ceratium fusus, Strain PA161109" /LENGTH=31 /DNA_ID= /DNA_START= /DNA_END= /DNA_ORIENTATION=